MSSTILGTSFRLTRNPIQVILQRSHAVRRIPLSEFSGIVAFRGRMNMIAKLCGLKKSADLSSQKSLTLSELRERLEAWDDPTSVEETMEAKNRILCCFILRSHSLDLSFLSLNTLPDVFDGMQHIQHLSISNNSFSELPQCLTKLASLKKLNISNNALNELPDYIKEFKQLEFLNCEHNKLRKISEELGYLSQLRTLKLGHNRIMQLPSNIHHITNVTLNDQLPLTSFSEFSSQFTVQRELTFRYKPVYMYL